MTNLERWVELHKEKRHQPRYPHELVVSFVLRNFKATIVDGGGCKILDLGCGAGKHTKFLAENGFEAYGCDYSTSGIKVSEQILDEANLKADFQVASIDALPYENEFFDGLICWGVLCYNDKQSIEKAADEMFRVLKKGAKALILTRNLEDYRYAQAQKISRYEAIIQENDESRSAFKENGMPMYFFDKDEVKRVFHRFARIDINRLRVSWGNDKFADDDFVIVCER